MTVFLTTHYMDEADAPVRPDRDHGPRRILVDGTAAQLKEAFSHAHLYEVEFPRNADRYETMLQGLPFVRSVERSGDLFRITLSGEEALKPLMDALGGADIRKICLKEPSLEDVL